MPEIFGAVFPVPPLETAVIVKAGNEAMLTPSETLIVMLEYVPTGGYPEMTPVAVLKFIQEGLLRLENFSVLPSGSDAVG